MFPNYIGLVCRSDHFDKYDLSSVRSIETIGSVLNPSFEREVFDKFPNLLYLKNVILVNLIFGEFQWIDHKNNWFFYYTCNMCLYIYIYFLKFYGMTEVGIMCRTSIPAETKHHTDEGTPAGKKINTYSLVGTIDCSVSNLHRTHFWIRRTCSTKL